MKVLLYPKKPKLNLAEKILIIVPHDAKKSNKTSSKNFKQEFQKNLTELEKASNEFFKIIENIL